MLKCQAVFFSPCKLAESLEVTLLWAVPWEQESKLEALWDSSLVLGGEVLPCLAPSWQIDGETMETVTDFILLGSKITADGDCSHEIKRRLLLGRKVMTHLLLLLSHFSCVQLSATPETAAHQAPPSLGFSRQEHWSGLPLPSPMHESEK